MSGTDCTDHMSHITFRDCRMHFFPTTFLEIAVYVVVIKIILFQVSFVLLLVLGIFI